MVADPVALHHIFHKSGYRYRKGREAELQGLQVNGPGVFAVQGQHSVLVPIARFKVLNGA